MGSEMCIRDSLNFSRIGFRGILVPFFICFGFYLYFLAKRKNSKLFSFLCGIFLGLGFYSYIPYRAALILILILFLWEVKNKGFNKVLKGLAGMGFKENDLREFGSLIEKILAGDDLSEQQAYEAFVQVLSERQPALNQGAFLAALRAKGENVDEIAGCWSRNYSNGIHERVASYRSNCRVDSDDDNGWKRGDAFQFRRALQTGRIISSLRTHFFVSVSMFIIK